MKDSSNEDDDDFDVGDAIGDILEGAFGIFRNTVKTVSHVVRDMVRDHVSMTSCKGGGGTVGRN